MLERLSKHTHFCFPDGYSGFSQIPVSADDQAKTTQVFEKNQNNHLESNNVYVCIIFLAFDQ